MAIESNSVDANRKTSSDAVSKVNLITSDTLTLDVYYFEAGQELAYHRHPTGNQIFTVLEGSGTFKLDDGTEETLEVCAGSTFLVPANVWHALVDSGDGKLVAQQVTKQPAGMEVRGA